MGKFIKFILTAFVVISLLFTLGCKKASSERVISVATDATWPPMEMIDSNGNIVGFDIDLINAAAEAGGFKVEIRSVAWENIFVGLESGEYDAIITSVTITEERKKQYDFSIPYIIAGQVLIVRDEEDDCNSLQDLVGRSVGTQIGTTGVYEIEKIDGVKLKSYGELGFAIENLANGAIDCVVSDTPIAASYVFHNDKYKGKLKIVGAPFTEEYYGIVVKKGNIKVLNTINAGLKKILGTEIVSQLENKWLR